MAPDAFCCAQVVPSHRKCKEKLFKLSSPSFRKIETGVDASHTVTWILLSYLHILLCTKINSSYAECSGVLNVRQSFWLHPFISFSCCVSPLPKPIISVFCGSVTELGSHLPWRPTRSRHAEAEILILRIWCTPKDEHRLPSKEPPGFESLMVFSVDKGKKLTISNHSSYFQRVFHLRDAHGKKHGRGERTFKARTRLPWHTNPELPCN